MEKPRTTPKDFFLWAGAIVSFYWSIVAFVFLIFDYINYAFPNPIQYYPGNLQSSGVPYEMASIIVLLPVYMGIVWLIRRDIRRDATRREVWVRRWALLFTLFAAGATVAVDLITLLTSFLGGDELTTPFLLKVLIVFLVAAGVFMHFISELWGYWEEFPQRRRRVDIGVGVLAVATVLSGFLIMGTPFQARLYQFDEQKVSDLQEIQSQIINYWQQKQKLPENLSDLNDPISGFTAPPDPQTNLAYAYKATGKTSFELCAAFNAETQFPSPYTPQSPMGSTGDSWQHAAGEVCFERTIDPGLYPPLNKAL